MRRAVRPFRDAIRSPVSCEASRILGRAMRADGVQLFRYLSARDRRGGINVGAFIELAFAEPQPLEARAISCRSAHAEVSFALDAAASAHRFHRRRFLVEGEFPLPMP